MTVLEPIVDPFSGGLSAIAYPVVAFWADAYESMFLESSLLDCLAKRDRYVSRDIPNAIGDQAPPGDIDIASVERTRPCERVGISK